MTINDSENSKKLKALGDAWSVPELRRKLLFTLGIIALYRLGVYVPLPGVSHEAFAMGLQTGQSSYPTCTDNAITFLFALFTGGAFNNLSVFSLGIIPYITAAVLMQSMTVAIPRLQELAKEGETGQQRITQYTRYFTLVLAAILSLAMVLFLRNGSVFPGVLTEATIIDLYLIWLTLTASAMLIMWLGELISQRGLGNGISLLITVSILSQAPSAISALLEGNVLNMVVLVILAIIIVATIVFVNEGQRRIPVTYAKRQVGRRMSQGGTTYLPLKVNMAGDHPITYASSLLIFPTILAQLFAGCNEDSILGRLAAFFSPENAPYLVLYALLVLIFTYFYTAVQFNPIEQADNLKKRGGYIPGIRPGQPTAVYLNNVLTRITLFGALFLTVVAVVPYLISGALGLGQEIFLGGTSMLLVVAFSLDAVVQLESQLMRRKEAYEGFLKGRR